MIVHTDELKSGKNRGKLKALISSKSTRLGGCAGLVGVVQMLWTKIWNKNCFT
jgi:hypothetical protein